MTRMKKYLVAACSVTVMAGAPTAAFALTAPTPTATDAAPTVAASTAKKGSVRVVAPDEKVAVQPGLKMWLTKHGEVCEQYSSETPNCSKPKARSKLHAYPSVQAVNPNNNRMWLSGVYNSGKEAPAGVRVRTLGGPAQGTVVTLVSNPAGGSGTSRPAPPSPCRSTRSRRPAGSSCAT